MYVTNSNSFLRKYQNIIDEIEGKFGIMLSEITPVSSVRLPWWVEIDDYNSYLLVGQEREDAYIKTTNQPFIIYDYREIPDAKLFHAIEYGNDYNEVLDWFIGCIDFYPNTRWSCKHGSTECIYARTDECRGCTKYVEYEYDGYNCVLCDYNSEANDIRRKNCILPKCVKDACYSKQELLLQLGDFCVFGWETNLTQYVNRKLSEISNHSCAHMG